MVAEFQLVVTDEGVSRLIRLAGFQRPVNDALFGMLSREEIRSFASLLSRLAANGSNALKLAGHVETTMKLVRQGAKQSRRARG